MQCPFCNRIIDDDSWYCDQCGQELMFCAACDQPRKGKMCTVHGSRLAPRGGAGAAPPTIVPPEPAAATATLHGIHLINQTLGLDLLIVPGDVIGRGAGRFAELLKPHASMSKQHGRFTLDPVQGLQYTDLGSTNGSKHNRMDLPALQPQSLHDLDYLQIANVEFLVRIPTEGDGTIRI